MTRIRRLVRAAFAPLTDESLADRAPSWEEVAGRLAFDAGGGNPSAWLHGVRAAIAVLVMAGLLVLLRPVQPNEGNELSEADTTRGSPPLTSVPAVGATSSIPMSPIVPIWEYPSEAIGRYVGMGRDFLANRDFVAVVTGPGADGLALLDTGSGRRRWTHTFAEQPGWLLALDDGQVAWGTQQRVGVHSLDGAEVWEHRFVDGRWPSRVFSSASP